MRKRTSRQCLEGYFGGIEAMGEVVPCHARRYTQRVIVIQITKNEMGCLYKPHLQHVMAEKRKLWERRSKFADKELGSHAAVSGISKGR